MNLNIYRIVQSGAKYSTSNAIPMKNLFYSYYGEDIIPKVTLSGLVFYYGEYLMKLPLNEKKLAELSNSKPGEAIKLFHTTTNNYLYAIQLDDNELEQFNALRGELNSVDEVNRRLEELCGPLLKTKKEHEKKIKKLKESFMSSC